MKKNTAQFSQRVLAVVSKIPKGEVWTYQKVAELAGNRLAARAVGTILSKNYNPEVPCHRVIRTDGGLGGYNRGLAQKEKLLREENAVF